MKKYLTRNWADKIQIIEVERETDESVWIKGRRNAKKSNIGIYHDTFGDAKQALVERHEKDIKVARDKIHRAESALGTIRKMTEADAQTQSDRWFV
ncbi:hypothetical protein [Burkholderia cepacia]|uniref:hypothetical protein n=1 Tax=Burkholderia cepacia TaxID=292 RepID=UPI001F3CC20E|nr:hypothetical protein [Burkholderia cepacia]UIY58156.1 hypothetical protein LZ568_08050 [Burkholderia cepacia]